MLTYPEMERMNHLASFTATHWLREHELGIRIAEYQRILQMLEGHTTPASDTLRKQLVEVIGELELTYRCRLSRPLDTR